jgi:hypothetical protein
MVRSYTRRHVNNAGYSLVVVFLRLSKRLCGQSSRVNVEESLLPGSVLIWL